MRGYLQTGQARCYDSAGQVIPCDGTGQDAEFGKGTPWPVPRFEENGGVIRDLLTGLVWMRNANPREYPMTWQESLDYIILLNMRGTLGFSDWRIPNRRELRSLISHQTKKPALPEGHPFREVYPGWYWTSTTAAINTSYAWYIHMEGGRMFYGGKEQSFLVWPIRSSSNILPSSGQNHCYDAKGRIIPCADSNQDGDFRSGFPWPEPRFKKLDDAVIDGLTGLCWSITADLSGGRVTWRQAFESIADLNSQSGGRSDWRLPNINELESIVDCSAHSPALPTGHPFLEVKDTYWSSTTSTFEPDWAWALYIGKGAIGVGQKGKPHFYAWAVCDSE